MKDKLKAIKELKNKDRKFSMLTAYDATIARVIDEQQVEVILVGDSLGMLIQGYQNTSLVTLADMVYHTAMVKRGLDQALLMADIPMGCALNSQIALESALSLMRAGADIVKFEASFELLPTLTEIHQQGIAFCAHIGLRPQQVIKEGGYYIKGKTKEEADALLDLAKKSELAGADILLLECVVSEVATEITKSLKIPVIGIGSGAGTDAQVLVIYDILGLNLKPPRFVKDFIEDAGSIAGAVKLYREQVLKGGFPTAAHSYMRS